MRKYLLGRVMVLCACGGEPDSDGHMWQEQTDLFDKARDVEVVLGTATGHQRQRIEDQSQ